MKVRLVIPKLDSSLFTESNHLEPCLVEEFGLENSLNSLQSFIRDHSIGYYIDIFGDPDITFLMFDVDGCLFWRSFVVNSPLLNYVKLG